MNHHQGHIKYWNNSKGYGFIARPGNDDIFVHISQLARHIAPRAGLEVVFELKQDHKGRWQAQNVELAGKGQTDTPAGTAINSHQPPAGPLQRLWRLVLMIAALVLAGFILLKSITPFYSMQGANGPYTQAGAATSPLLPGTPHADNPQLQHTLQLILQGGPYPYRQDNGTFHNRERLLPQKPPGYYREYTVPTPGASNRSTRRVVTGGNPPEVWYYTEDHYRSFIRLEVRP